MSKRTLAVLFGGETVEHEVSVITAVQLMKNADREKYDILPLYVDKAGQWWTGDQLLTIASYGTQDLFKPTGLLPYTLNANKNSTSIDVAILCFHGAYGEAGNVQGLLELAGIPYQGPPVTSSAAAFDKIITRQILKAEGINQANFIWFTHQQWLTNPGAVLTQIKGLGLPVFIKPANGGSTIGIEKVKDENQLTQVINQVCQYDERVLVETEIKDCIEVNVSVLGIEGNTRASVPEQPIKADEFLSYADKYERGGGKKSGMASANRRIPAPISSTLTTKLQDLAKHLFRIFDCTGVVRIDFFVDPSEETIYVVELNTIPGSMSFYLWEATGLPYPQLIDELVTIALEKHARKQKLITSFESNILKNKTEI
ncbi:MAG TPA: D-alanine--D-alanine ligase family protein [Vitreimonas sp.]|nr:D-alanine--D-alanine ligase family protein [Vitreimonas sp.]